jgi:hypothetical protein
MDRYRETARKAGFSFDVLTCTRGYASGTSDVECILLDVYGAKEAAAAKGLELATCVDWSDVGESCATALKNSASYPLPAERILFSETNSKDQPLDKIVSKIPLTMTVGGVQKEVLCGQIVTKRQNFVDLQKSLPGVSTNFTESPSRPPALVSPPIFACRSQAAADKYKQKFASARAGRSDMSTSCGLLFSGYGLGNGCAIAPPRL